MRTETKNLTDNELIAEFMGGKFNDEEISTYGGMRTGKWNFLDGRWCYNDQLDYGSSWDWLMPVVEKIENTRVETQPHKLAFEFEVSINGSHVTIDSSVRPNGQKNVRFTKVEGTKIESTYKAVVEFIKWYNQQNES